MTSPPPSYNMATNYGYQGSPQPAATANTERAQLLGLKENTGAAQQGGYPPQQGSYPQQQGSYGPQQGGYGPQQGGYGPQQGGYGPQQGGYTQPGQDPAYPMPPAAYAPPPRAYPQGTMYGQGMGYGQSYGNPQSYGQRMPGVMPAPQAHVPTGSPGGIPSPRGTAGAGQPKPWIDDDFAGDSFNNKAIRMAFIRKVYIILMVQLSFTFLVVLFFSLHEPTQRWVQSHTWIYWPSYFVFLVTYIILVCCPSVRRKWPINFICLVIFTCSLTYMAGMISSMYTTQSVVVAIGITAGVTIAITIFSCQTKWDFTKCGGILFAACIALLLFGMVSTFWYIFVGYSSMLQVVYGGLAALLFSMFLAYDTQMLLGNKKYRLSPEDHVFGALQLYLDIIYLFLIILSLFGNSE